MNIVYLIGAPGAGKTTTMNALTRDWCLLDRAAKPVKHSWYSSDHGVALELGHPRAPFGGTDTLSYTAITTLEAWLPTVTDCQLIVGEGDRLAIARFMELARKLGQLHLFYLDTPPQDSQARREQRALDHGLKLQNPAWAEGRATKHARLAEQYQAHRLPPGCTPEEYAQQIEAHLS